jgi:ABC-type branched-subunit amino acid transport system permease subunit
MQEFLLFVMLGLGAGAAYALLGVGVVAVYKGSGILNFSQGAMAMFAAYCYVALANLGISPGFAALLTVAGAALSGALIYVVVIKALRNAPQLAKAVTTIGLLLAFQGLADLIWGTSTTVVPSLLPTGQVNVFDVSVGEDRLWAVLVVVVIAIGLATIYRRTIFGLATQAAAENERGAALIGFSPDVISAGNWALGGACAALAGVILVPITGLDINLLTLMIVPALAAALLGSFRSFGITVVAGTLIGVIQSELTNYTTLTGAQAAVPFLVIILAMVLAGRTIPERGTLGYQRPPYAPRTRINPLTVLGVGGLFVLGLVFFSDVYSNALTTSMIITIVALSLVVVTGFLGQISLAQMAFAGAGAFSVAKLGSSLDLAFPWPLFGAAIVATLASVLVGLPALRVRGLSLAVITLGFAVAVYAAVFSNPDFSGGSGLPVKAPGLWGFSLNPATHPMRFGLVVLAAMGLCALAVLNLRRSPSGQRMLAVRSNERAAAASGLNVTVLKLQGTALSALIASLGGGLAAYQFGFANPGQFDPFASILILTVAYIGGIACVSGAVVAGLIASGGVLFTLLSGIGALTEYWILISGVALVATALTQPDGVAVQNMQILTAVRQRLGRRSSTDPVGPPRGQEPPGSPTYGDAAEETAKVQS